MEASSIEKQITNYLPQLTVKQKKAVLAVVKTFAEDENMNDYSVDFKKELDNRYEEYLNGDKLVSETEANQRIKKNHQWQIKIMSYLIAWQQRAIPKYEAAAKKKYKKL